MKKIFSVFSRVAAIVFTTFFVFSLFSCTGLLASSSETGSVSFILDKSVFDAARSGDTGEDGFSYRVEVSLEDGKNFGVKQTVNISEDDFKKSKKTDAVFEAKFPRVPAGKNIYAIVKIYEQFPHHQERDLNNFEPEPIMIGKSDVYKIKLGKNEISLNAYNYRYNFPFSITITFDELSESDISAITDNLLITAVAADSDEAKRIVDAGTDKYKIYEALSNSLIGEAQLAKSYGASFTFNQSAKKLTVSGKMPLPINLDEAASKGKDVILVAAMYKYDSYTSKFKTKLFGQSEKISPLKAVTNEVAFAAKKLNVVDTPVVLFEENMVATGYYTGSKEHSIYNSEGHGLVGLLGPIFCFDSDGNIYTIIESSQDGYYELNTNNISLETCLIPKYSRNFENQYITVDLANNCFYSYYPFENELSLYQYPDYISAGQVDEENKWTFNPGSVEIDGHTISPEPMSCIINDGIVYLIAKDGSSNDAGYFLYEHVLGEEGRHTLTNAKKIDLPYGDITDVIYLDGNLYFLAEYPLTGWGSVISSRGVVVKYDIDDNTFESVGISSDKVENTSMTENVGVHLYLNTSQLFTDSGRNNPVVLKGNTAISTGLLNSEFPTICTPNPLNKTLSTTALYGASKIIAIKPKKLVISEDGIAFYTENDQLFFKNVNRIVTIDLETFALEFEDTDVSFCDDKHDMYSSLMEDTVFNSFFWQTNFEPNTTLYPANDGTAFNSSTVPNATFYICISNKED